MKSFAPARRRRYDRWLAGLYLLAVFAIGCSTQGTTTPASSTSTAAAPPSDVADGNLSGLWTGTTSTGGYIGMAGKTRNIKLVIRQVGGKLTGSYRCSAGNSLCRNGDEKGSIDGTANGTQVYLNIMLLPDASNCRYAGTLDYNGNGSYTCYGQGQIVEQGTWVATR
jgi:hypothetical protein